MTSKDRELLIQARAVLSDIETHFGCTSYLTGITAAIDAHLSELPQRPPLNPRGQPWRLTDPEIAPQALAGYIRETLIEAQTYCGSESWSPSMVDQLAHAVVKLDRLATTYCEAMAAALVEREGQAAAPVAQQAIDPALLVAKAQGWWNSLADEYNKWSELGEDEKLEAVALFVAQQDTPAVAEQPGVVEALKAIVNRYAYDGIPNDSAGCVDAARAVLALYDKKA